ncbi:outer membrane beta-barrel protein [Crenobacter sp. SG2305]|uniref:outer membrane beta-barrel protein n=1 Tax=Crenobacter oryzisoli TaxID=3056844 RepID=UPI0025AA9C86|nr:outer membrane beta-barrel protein [Crenobacter sp. SG2305]MDN0085782.1 outer membrane beta-barrel protein [Crenobacter sp. SG2305]
MSLKKLVIATALTTVSTLTLAAGFDGPFVQAGVGFADTETKTSGDISFLGDSSKTDTIGQIAAGYSQSFGQYNIAGDIFYVIGDQKSGDHNVSNGVNSIDVHFKGTNTWGINIEPGFYLNDQALLYAKIGYSETKGKGDVSGIISGDLGSETFHGFGYGLGFKYKFHSNLYGLAELEQIDYHEKNNVKPNSLIGTIGVGYQFQ